MKKRLDFLQQKQSQSDNTKEIARRNTHFDGKPGYHTTLWYPLTWHFFFSYSEKEENPNTFTTHHRMWKIFCHTIVSKWSNSVLVAGSEFCARWHDRGTSTNNFRQIGNWHSLETDLWQISKDVIWDGTNDWFHIMNTGSTNVLTST